MDHNKLISWFMCLLLIIFIILACYKNTVEPFNDNLEIYEDPCIIHFPEDVQKDILKRLKDKIRPQLDEMERIKKMIDKLQEEKLALSTTSVIEEEICK